MWNLIMVHLNVEECNSQFHFHIKIIKIQMAMNNLFLMYYIFFKEFYLKYLFFDYFQKENLLKYFWNHYFIIQ